MFTEDYNLHQKITYITQNATLNKYFSKSINISQLKCRNKSEFSIPGLTANFPMAMPG